MSPPAPKAARVHTIPAGVPFVDALAAGIVAGTHQDPLELAGAIVLLPTRRACRALMDAFLRHGDGRPMLLPSLVPLGDVDDDDLALLEAASADAAPPAMPSLRRQLLLTRLVLGRRDTTPDQAARLATELARLIDQVHTERLSFDGLAELVPDAYATHWQVTLRFLGLATEHWPAILAAEGCVDGAARRNQVLEARAEAWRRDPPQGLVVAAGSTGSIPATADLLAVVAGLPRGCVVLPGLDAGLDAASRAALSPSHPQSGMVRLLEHLGVDFASVTEWPHRAPGATPPGRAALIAGALRPAATFAAWRRDAAMDAAALDGVTRIDCDGPDEEAGAIAMVMRRTLETPGRTAALVTPDRRLARRVGAALRRWNVDVDDSAGAPLAETPPGAFLRLSARLVADDFAPVPLLAACKHPLAAGGMAPAAFRRAVRRLELAALRGPRPGRGVGGLKRAMRRDAGRDAAPLLAALKRCTDGFVKLVRRKRVGLAELLRAHVAMAEALAETDEASGAARLWAGDAGEAAARFVADVDGAAGALGHLAGADYAALLDTLMTGRVVRPRFGLHPRLHVWGLLEARLQHTDVMILGGLNEDTWPPAVDASPWMSRPMMRQFGLPLPERRIGLAAHDFCQAFSAPEVVLTRAARVEGTPTVPSRWLLRLENGLVGTPLEGALAPDRTVAAWFAQLDAAHDFRPVAPPAPLPPVAARPRALSVTRVETWVRDPYAVYAERILGLEPLDPIDADPGAAERGSIVHRALELFLETHAEALPEDPYAALVAIGETVFAGTMERPGVRAFWWPRFLRMAGWFADWEAARRAGGTVTVGFEASAELSLAAPAGPFVLRAKADRIDRRPDGRLAILDYKTGEAPSAPQVESGLAPQLSLEAAMARLGAFTDVAAAEVAELAYVRLSGGRMPGEEKRLKLDPAAVADEALARLSSRVALFDDAATPYLSRPHPKFIDHAGAYDHLARVGEWVAGGTP